MLPGFIFGVVIIILIVILILKIFLLNLKIGVDICLIFCYNKANERQPNRRI